MARPKGTAEQLAGLRKEALDLYNAGVPIPEIARRVRRTETAIRQWVREAESPDSIIIEQLRKRVRARLQEAQSARMLTGGKYLVWKTEALPWAFGKDYRPGATGSALDDAPIRWFVEWVLDWDCHLDEQGVWRAR
ncbi:helix-turn-helix domain-containing protein [Gemmatimonas sp.]|uniref:helix-turn-helix domain-containing protein n=1 Tax=Gemmatimonas sp. TaxID=1962908 RepID=UPI0025C174EF|nr:helix-turn-helix domain-containing protein [Gemmatimonas sp.]MCA2993949.1 hypothetical protein [Gemmatimonas sp.]